MRVIIVERSHEFAIELNPQESVLDIKRKIEQILRIPVASQILAMFGWELIDGLDVEDYPIIVEGTKVELTINHTHLPILKNPSTFHITLKFSNRQVSIEVDKTETVRSLKEKIHIIESTPIKRMTLFFSGREMEEDFRNLSEYGIFEFSEIIVFLKHMSHVREDPPVRKLSVVVQTSSSLFNGACIPLVEIKDSITVSDLRKILLGEKILPIDDYIFIHKQRIMRENCSLRWHGVENGDFLYVFKGTVSRGEF